MVRSRPSLPRQIRTASGRVNPRISRKTYAERLLFLNMAATGPRAAFWFSTPVKWSVIAGGYLLLCAAGLLLVLSQVTALVAELLGLPAGSPLGLAAPAPIVGAVVWWAGVERRDAFTYRSGGVVGLVTGLLTVVFWLLWGVTVWGIDGILAGWPLVVAVLVPTLPVGIIAGLPLMYARRRLRDPMADTERS